MTLGTGTSIVELADRFTQSADAIHDSLLQAIVGRWIDLAAAQRVLQDEAVLRQMACALYLDAADHVMADLQPAQENLLAVVDHANDRLRSTRNFSRILDLIADLLLLAAAVRGAKPGSIAAALQAVKQDVEGLDQP